jgi:pilus assembly protein Flp/PilA
VGETRQTRRLSDAAGRRAAGGLAARYSLTLVRGFWRDERGATAIEYGLIIALIFLVIVGAITNFATNATTVINKAAAAIVQAG